MGWFSKLTKSVGGGIGNLLGGIVGGTVKPVAESANGLLSNPNFGAVLGGIGGVGGILNSIGLGRRGEGESPSTPTETSQNNNQTMLLILGGILLFIFGKKLLK